MESKNYDKLRTLKNICRGNKELLVNYHILEDKINKDSNNILVICRTWRSSLELLSDVAKSYIDKARIQKSKGILTIEGTTITFLPISRLGTLDGMRYKEYYFEEDFAGGQY